MRELERIWESVGSEQEVWGSQSEIYIAKFGDFSSHGAKLRLEKMINIKMAKSRFKTSLSVTGAPSRVAWGFGEGRRDTRRSFERRGLSALPRVSRGLSVRIAATRGGLSS